MHEREKPATTMNTT